MGTFVFSFYIFIFLIISFIFNFQTFADKEFEPHEINDQHNSAYDHKLFLGEEEAKAFDDLPPDESKKGFEEIINRIDKDKDSFVSQEELQEWIQYVQRRTINEDTESQWKEFITHDLIKDNKVYWEDYRKRLYGFLDNPTYANKDGAGAQKFVVMRDERKWKKADIDGDGALTKEEFTAFIHPEHFPRMKDIVVQETLEDIDKDKDGFISQEEYVNDLWPDAENDGKEPDWLKTEKENFQKYKDEDGDGKLDFEETSNWVLPDDYDQSQSEMLHLFKEADADEDGKLSHEEMLDEIDVFVGSQATAYGDIFLTTHDEL